MTRDEAEEVERSIRIAIWNAAMHGGMGQDLSQALIRRAMDEPLMQRALAALTAAEPFFAQGLPSPPLGEGE